MSDEIAAWLRKQAEADIRAARIISDGGFEPERWDTYPAGQANPPAHPGSAAVSAAIGQEPEYSCGWVPVRVWDHMIGSPPDKDPAPGAVAVLAEVGRRQFEHVIRHDPRTEVARAESVLAVLDLHEGEPQDEDADGYVRWLCTRCDDGYWPCRTVRLLAFGYRCREGWRETWRP